MPAAPAACFASAINEACHLQLRPGLKAVREGRGRISAKDPRCVLGSASIDEDCTAAYPNACRWDYVIDYQRRGQAIAHFVEVHPAEASAVAEVLRKFRWLQDYLSERAQRRLAGIPGACHWVASGRINIPKHLPQYKVLTTAMGKVGVPLEKLVLT